MCCGIGLHSLSLMPEAAPGCRIAAAVCPNFCGYQHELTSRLLAASIAPHPQRLAPGANDHLDFLGQVIYKRQTSGTVAGRSRFT
jgi:hypothetical protein